MRIDHRERERVVIALHSVLMRVQRGEESQNDARTLRGIADTIEGVL